jgi:hypothetical protein
MPLHVWLKENIAPQDAESTDLLNNLYVIINPPGWE